MLENVSSVFNLGASSEATGKPPFTSLRPKLGFGKGTFLSEDQPCIYLLRICTIPGHNHELRLLFPIFR